MASEFTAEIQLHLKKGGWFSGRKIDVSNYELVWRANDLAWFNSAKRFLEEFGNVAVYDLPQGSLIFFDSDDVLGFCDEVVAGFKQYNGNLKEKLCPIGSIDGSVLILMTQEEYIFFAGSNFSVYDLTLFDIGIDNFLTKYFDLNRKPRQT